HTHTHRHTQTQTHTHIDTALCPGLQQDTHTPLSVQDYNRTHTHTAPCSLLSDTSPRLLSYAVISVPLVSSLPLLLTSFILSSSLNTHTHTHTLIGYHSQFTHTYYTEAYMHSHTYRHMLTYTHKYRHMLTHKHTHTHTHTSWVGGRDSLYFWLLITLISQMRLKQCVCVCVISGERRVGKQCRSQ